MNDDALNFVAEKLQRILVLADLCEKGQKVTEAALEMARTMEQSAHLALMEATKARIGIELAAREAKQAADDARLAAQIVGREAN